MKIVDLAYRELRDLPQNEASDMTIRRKLWRLYYNRRDDFPFFVAVDNGTISTQIRVQQFYMHNVDFCCGGTDVGPEKVSVGEDSHSLRPLRKGKKNEPTWWIEFYARAVFSEGAVSFYGGGGQ